MNHLLPRRLHLRSRVATLPTIQDVGTETIPRNRAPLGRRDSLRHAAPAQTRQSQTNAAPAPSVRQTSYDNRPAPSQSESGPSAAQRQEAPAAHGNSDSGHAAAP